MNAHLFRVHDRPALTDKTIMMLVRGHYGVRGHYCARGHYSKILRCLALVTAALPGAAAQRAQLPVVPPRGALTNASLLTLASAGFNEDFILEAISASRTHFDVSVEAVAQLAKQGVSERVIRAMTAVARVPVTAQPVMALASPASTVVIKPKTIHLAIAAGASYSETTNVFWGLYKRRVGVSAAVHTDNAQLPHLGALYESVQPSPVAIPVGVLNAP